MKVAGEFIYSLSLPQYMYTHTCMGALVRKLTTVSQFPHSICGNK